ncbi:MAG: hypothetical protein EHM18_12395 [Acidobacteria bacterium]|nr:MAG: hypothetical protein EHM18_12395 [Acidobacteriota bacterium]
MVRNRMALLVFIAFSLSSLHVLGQAVWQVQKKPAAIQVDGFVQEWDAVTGLTLQAGAPGVRAEAITQSDDVTVVAKAAWDQENLYVALEWKDNTWDIERVLRQQAVWLTPQQQRRERMLFYDYLRFQMIDVEFDYLLWLSPRIENRGPFSWSRLLSGAKRMERATSPPAISARQQGGTATVEILLAWQELKTKPKAGKTLPLTLLVADSDLPGKPLELKLSQLKSLVWDGVIKLAE